MFPLPAVTIPDVLACLPVSFHKSIPEARRVGSTPTPTASRRAGVRKEMRDFLRRVNEVGSTHSNSSLVTGTITFRGAERHNRNAIALFSKLHRDATAQDVCSLLQDSWGLRDPSVVFSITGSSGELNVRALGERPATPATPAAFASD